MIEIVLFENDFNFQLNYLFENSVLKILMNRNDFKENFLRIFLFQIKSYRWKSFNKFNEEINELFEQIFYSNISFSFHFI